MPKLLLVLAMILVQIQPWVGALLCDQQMSAPDAAMVSMEHHTMPDASQLVDEPPDECPIMSACAATPSAVIPIVSDVPAVLPSGQELPRGHGLIPDQAFLAPPFHPPSA
jgi:hypothetical protein